MAEIKNDPKADEKIFQKEQQLKKQISKIENDVNLWKNNLEFFRESKNANELKEEFGKKITKADEELKTLKDQLRVIRSI